MREDSLKAFRVSIVIPAVDEPEVRDVVSALARNCGGELITETLVVLPEYATEGYRNFLRELQTEFACMNLRIVTQTGKGIGNALYEGYIAATGSHVLFIASDLENDPEDAIRMIRISKAHPDCIVTASRRLSDNGFGNYPRVKLLFNHLFYAFTRLVLRSGQTDPTYLFQCAPRRLPASVVFGPDHTFFVLEFAFLPEKAGVRYIETPSAVGFRKSGRSHTRLRDYCFLLRGALKLCGRIKNEKEASG